MDLNRMTLKLQEALQAASAQAMRRNHQGIDVEHLLLTLLEQSDGDVAGIRSASTISGTLYIPPEDMLMTAPSRASRSRAIRSSVRR